MTVKISELERYIPLSDVLEQFHITEEKITPFIKRGIVRAVALPGGELALNEKDLGALTPKEELQAYQKYSRLQGIAISISDASRKYGVNTATMTRWMQRGLIERLGKDGRRTLLNEADVAYCVEVYQVQVGQGRRSFNPNGTPYIPHDPRTIRG